MRLRSIKLPCGTEVRAGVYKTGPIWLDDGRRRWVIGRDSFLPLSRYFRYLWEATTPRTKRRKP